MCKDYGIRSEKASSPPIRLKGYDYIEPGAYFITVCTFLRECMLCEIQDGSMILNDLGEIIRQTWLDSPNHYPHVMLDAFCLMPNHFHSVIILSDAPGRGESQTRPYEEHYYERIIRDEREFNAIRQYINENPLRWELDRENPSNIN